jgi:developmental checkpoint coupling sporulation initiation to replication initiation
MLEMLSDEILIEAYIKALQLKLDPDFLRLLAAEMRRRKLDRSVQRLGA